MAKTPVDSWIHEPLSAILGTRGKVAVLRLLARALAPIPYREVARRSGMAYGSIDLALTDLVEVGLVERIEGGRERLVRINPRHRLANAVLGMLRVEADFFPALRIELRAVAEGAKRDGLLAVAMVGRTVRREERLGDPVELLILASDKDAAGRWEERFLVTGEALHDRFGTRLLPIAYDLARARVMWRTRTPSAERTVREAEMLFGDPLEALFSDPAAASP